MPRWNADITDRVCDILTLLGIADAYPEPERGRTIALAQTKAHAVRQLIGNDALRKSAIRQERHHRAAQGPGGLLAFLTKGA